MKLSIIIPCRNRRESVRELLQSLTRQTVNGFEVIICENGDTDGTENLLLESWPFPVKYCYTETGIQGAARNTGALASKGDYLLFLDSDTVAKPELIAEHVSYLYKNPDAVIIGNIVFPDYMHIHHQAKQYDLARYFRHFERYQKKGTLSFIQCITCNLLIPHTLFEAAGGISEAFTHYGYEDIEFGYRLMQMGARFVHAPKATAVHYHVRTIPEFCRRAYEMGQSAVTLYRLHPEIEEFIDIGIFRYLHSTAAKKAAHAQTQAIARKIRFLETTPPLYSGNMAADFAARLRRLHQLRTCYKKLHTLEFFRGIHHAFRTGEHAFTKGGHP